VIKASDVTWAAGFVEGEGSFTPDKGCPDVQVCQVQLWPLSKMERLFGGTIYPVTQVNKRPYFRWRVGGTRAVGFVMTLYSLLSPKRKRQIRAALSEWRKTLPLHKYRKACVHGHLYLAGSEYVNKLGHRVCRVCERARSIRDNKTERRKLYMREYKKQHYASG